MMVDNGQTEAYGGKQRGAVGGIRGGSRGGMGRGRLAINSRLPAHL